MAQEDNCDYFYRLKLDERLAAFFGMQPIRVGALLACMKAPPQSLVDLELASLVNA